MLNQNRFRKYKDKPFAVEKKKHNCFLFVCLFVFSVRTVFNGSLFLIETSLPYLEGKNASLWSNWSIQSPHARAMGKKCKCITSGIVSEL